MISELVEIKDQMMPIIRRTSDFILAQVQIVSQGDIVEKELNSLVSYVDQEAEKMLVEGLSQIIPASGFITEEDTEDDDSQEYTWIIDPLDGTTNFLHQVPHFGISVALQKNGKNVIGAVKEVNSGEEWTAIRKGGSALNNTPIQVSKKKFNDVLIATGWPYTNDFDYDAYLRMVKHWLTHTRGMRRLGSAALDLCYVACGRYGAYYESLLNPWDVAAGALIVEEAGGKVTDYNGGEDYLFGKQIIAASPSVYTDVFSIINKN